MKKVVTILTIMTVLIFRQDKPLPDFGIESFIYAIFQEAHHIHPEQGLGWIEERDPGDSWLMVPGLKVSHKLKRISSWTGEPEQYIYQNFFHPNPLLMDRPPPMKNHYL